MAQENVKIELEGPETIRIRFPKGVKAALRTSVPLDDLLRVLRSPEAEVQGQSASSLVFIPGAPD
jgi:hypothetical protein